MTLRNKFIASVLLSILSQLGIACSEAPDMNFIEEDEETAAIEQGLSLASSAVSYQKSGGGLAELGPDYTGTTSGTMMAGTSSSVAEMAGGYYRDAYQGKDGNLWINGPGGPVNQKFGMDSKSSPSITGLANGGYQVAFQANTHSLWVTGDGGTGDQRLGMMPGTNPSIAARPDNGWMVAFQANTGVLWWTGTAGTTNSGLKMAPNTSPSVAVQPNGSWRIAFQGADSYLYLHDSTTGTTNTWLGMKANTSPSITVVPGGGYEVAFQANTGSLWVSGSLGTGDLGLGMMAGTSPSITALLGGGYQIAFQANTGKLWVTGTQATGDTGNAMAPNTSPSICPVYAPGLSLSKFANKISGTNVSPVSGARDLLFVCMDKGSGDPMPSYSDMQALGSKVQAYFQENSGARLTFKSVSFRGCGGTSGTYKSVKVDRPVPEQWTEALNFAVASGFNFRSYDKNNDGRISGSELAIAVVRQTGPGADYGTAQVATFQQSGNVKADIADIYLTPGVAPIKYGLLSHELLHVTANTIDLYNDIPSGQQPYRPGVYSIMDNHTSGTHLDPIHKLKLGWSTPGLRSLLTQEFTLGPVETTGNFTILADNHGAREYFIVENRSTTASAFDANLPQGGVLVWRVVEDTNLANLYSPTKRIERWGWQLLTATPLQPISAGGTAFALPWLENASGYTLSVVSNTGGIARVQITK